MPACPYCSSSDLTRDGHDQRGRVVRACRACDRHATVESVSLVAGHRFPRDIILLAVRYYLQLGAAAERIAGILADRGVDVSGRTILRWVQKFGPALSEEIRRYRKPVSTTWLVDETYVKILGRWHYLYRGVDSSEQPLSSNARPQSGRVPGATQIESPQLFAVPEGSNDGCDESFPAQDGNAAVPCSPDFPTHRHTAPYRRKSLASA